MEKNKINNLIIRMFFSLITFFFICFLIDNNILNKEIITENLIDFSYIRSKTKVLLGSTMNKKDIFVTSEKIKYKNIENYKDSYKLKTDYNYVVKSITNGVVIYIGNKEDLGTTVIINGEDGTNIWYSNIENINVNLYDSITMNTILGSTINDTLYLTFIKDKEYISYEKYI